MLDLTQLEKDLHLALENETEDSLNRFIARMRYKELCAECEHLTTAEEIKKNIIDRNKELDIILKPINDNKTSK